MKIPRGKTVKDFTKQTNNQEESPLTHAAHNTGTKKHIVTQISSQVTGSSDWLMRLQKERNRCPL